MFRLEMLPARCGDCLLLEYGPAGASRLVVIDGYHGFMATPTESGDRYVTIGEDWAVGASKTGKNKDIALKYIDFLAEPENMTKLTKMTNNDSALDGIDVNLGKINDTYTKWFQSPIPPKGLNLNFPMSDELKQLIAKPTDKSAEQM